MSLFEELKDTLKDKWLEYYQTNQAWIDTLEENKQYVYSDDGSRPNSSFILGAISILEPRIKELLIFCCSLNSNPDKLVEVLGLDFDPNKEIERRSQGMKTTES